MAVNFYFQDKRVSTVGGKDYLHFFARNVKNINSSSIYQQISDARSRIAKITSSSILGSANSNLNVEGLSPETRETVEKFLSGQLFNNLGDIIASEDGEQKDIGGGSIVDTLNNAANNWNVASINLNNFVSMTESVLNQILSAANVNMTAQEYGKQILAEYIKSNGSTAPTGAFSAQIVQSILQKNNGNFFTVSNLFGNSNLNTIISEMAALVASIPDSGLSGKEVVAVGTSHIPIENALKAKVSQWFSYLSANTGELASAIGLGEVAQKSYDEISSITKKTGISRGVAINVDPALEADTAAIKAATSRLSNMNYASNILQVTANIGGVSATIGIQVKNPGTAKTITPETQSINFNIVEDSNLLTVLTRDAALTEGTLFQLIQILTYQDSPGYAGYEEIAQSTWQSILDVVPYLVLANKLTSYMYNTSVPLNNSFFAYGGRIWPATVVVNRVLNNLSNPGGTTDSAAFFTGLDTDASQFVNMNRFIQTSGGNTPETFLAIERSQSLHSRVLSQLMAMKVSVKVRLADLAIVSGIF